MPDPTVDAFFYGLFMDETLLREKGLDPRRPRRAALPGHALRIGQRATLVPEFGGQAFGMVFALTHAELTSLYAPAGFDKYRPVPALASFEDGTVGPVTVYILPEPPAPGEGNPEYAAKLRAVLTRLGLPTQNL